MSKEITHPTLDALPKDELAGLAGLVADRLANFYAEVTTFNHTDAAKLLNIGRTQIYEYEKLGVIAFGSDNRVSLAELRDCRRRIAEGVVNDDDEEIKRKSQKPKRRKF